MLPFLENRWEDDVHGIRRVIDIVLLPWPHMVISRLVPGVCQCHYCPRLFIVVFMNLFFCFLMQSTDLGNTASAFRTCSCRCAAIPMETSASRKLTWLPASVGGLKTGPRDLWLRLPGKSFPSPKTEPWFLSFLKHCCDKKWMYNLCGHLSSSLRMMERKARSAKRSGSESFMQKFGTNKSTPLLTNQFVLRFLKVSKSLKCCNFPFANWPASSSC